MIASSVHCSGADLYVETSGTGPAILLIHSGVTDSRMWDDLSASLASTHTVIRHDLRGHGRSTIPPRAYAHHADALAVLDACGIDRAVVVGASMGGGVALALALTHPERVAALVLINTLAGMVTPSPELRAGWDAVNAAWETNDLDQATEIELRMWVDGPFRQPHEVDLAIRERVREMDHALLSRAAEQDAAEELDLNPPARDRLADITCPVLLIVGLLDYPDALTSAAALESGLPNVRRVDIPTAAHLPSMEQPAAVLDAIDRFLATTLPGERARTGSNGDP
jgi:pimeloyl-ACP methyl ester carboxylesterase